MQRKLSGMICLSILIFLMLCACGKSEDLVDISTVEGDGYLSILWEGRTYVPFCPVPKSDCGSQIGYLDGETDNRVCGYKEYPPEEWIATYLTVDGGALLYKEVNVTEIPDGLESEYLWNVEKEPEELPDAAKEDSSFEEDMQWDKIPMVRVNGKLYYDTNRESTIEARCGMMDGEITSTVDGTEVPMEDNQSNFGSGYGFQYGIDDTLEIYVNEKWIVFEQREGNE